MSVAIEDFRAEKKLEVAQQVRHNEEQQRAAGDGHDVFFTERGFEQMHNDVHVGPGGVDDQARQPIKLRPI